MKADGLLGAKLGVPEVRKLADAANQDCNEFMIYAPADTGISEITPSGM